MSEIVAEPLVLPALQGGTRESVLREMVESLAAQQPQIDTSRLFEVLCERERLGSTGIAEGVAIPHGRLPGLPGMMVVVGRHQEGVDFGSLDGSPTKLFFLLVAPQEKPGRHLTALAHVSRLVKDASFRRGLMSARDRHELYLRIVAQDAR